MTGGTGDDWYFVHRAGDSLVEFAGEGSDRVFAGVNYTLSAGAFATGTSAADADDRIVYDAATGSLWFDADGNGAGAAVLFATLTAGTTLVAGDIVVI